MLLVPFFGTFIGTTVMVHKTNSYSHSMSITEREEVIGPTLIIQSLNRIKRMKKTQLIVKRTAASDAATATAGTFVSSLQSVRMVQASPQ